MKARTHIAMQAYGRTILLSRLLRTRASIERYHDRRSTRLLADAAATIPFYGQFGTSFFNQPVIDKALQQQRFADFNRLGLTSDDVVAAMAAGEDRVLGHLVGHSTGTSGNRGVFVISEAERMTWLGTIVAKTMPGAILRSRRVALALPGFSDLYRSASDGSRVRLRFFDLAAGMNSWRSDFAKFRPHAVVAPPKILRQLAEDGALAGVEAFSGAEVLDPYDRSIIEAAARHPVRDIYMATEGLFGVGCRYGTLHLAEDVIRFEWEPIAGSTLVVPVVTDLVRRVQPMIRYRMNDLLELSDAPCRCGSAFRAIAQIHGRMDDAFHFRSDGRDILVTPDVLRNAVVDAHPSIQDFRIVQNLDGHVTVRLDAAVPPEVDMHVRRSVEYALARVGVAVPVETERGIAPRLDRKLRRVERLRG